MFLVTRMYSHVLLPALKIKKEKKDFLTGDFRPHYMSFVLLCRSLSNGITHCGGNL